MASISPPRRHATTSTSSLQAIDERLAELNERLRRAQTNPQMLGSPISPPPSQPRMVATAGSPVALGSLYSPRRRLQEAPNYKGTRFRGTREPAAHTGAAEQTTRTPSARHDERVAVDARYALPSDPKGVEHHMGRVASSPAAPAAEVSNNRVGGHVDAVSHGEQTQEKQLELTARRTALERQVEDLRASIRRAEAENIAMEREHMALERRQKEVAALLKEKERAAKDENEQQKAIRDRLEARLVELEEENRNAAQRLRQSLAQRKIQEDAWRDEEQQMLRECQDTETLAEEQQARLHSLRTEIAERERELDLQRRIRERRASELAAEREAERAADAVKAEAAYQRREAELLRERDASLAVLRGRIALCEEQVSFKRREREAQEEIVGQLDVRLAELQEQDRRKGALQSECETLQKRLDARIAERDRLAERARELANELRSKDERLAELDRDAQRLAARLEDEGSLRQRVDQLAQEIAETQLKHAADQAASAQRLMEREKERDRAREELATLQRDMAAAREASAAERETLRHRWAALRDEASARDAELAQATRDNALKQTNIAEFEEQRRRVERETMARKAAAAHAAKVALQELSLF